MFEAVVAGIAPSTSVARPEEKKPPCSHERQPGFPCADPVCVRGAQGRDFMKGKETFRRTKQKGVWLWYKVC